MKKLLSGLALAGTFVLATAQTISFDKTTWDYGTIKQGADGHRVFTVKNTGDKPLILSSVKASCGCTVPSWDKKPIAPGKSAKIKVGYDTKRTGNFRKSIQVFSNDPKKSRSVIYITGNVQGNKRIGKKAAPVKKKLTPLQQAENKVKHYESKVERLEASLTKIKMNLKSAKKDLKTAKKTLKNMKKK